MCLVCGALRVSYKELRERERRGYFSDSASRNPIPVKESVCIECYDELGMPVRLYYYYRYYVEVRLLLPAVTRNVPVDVLLSFLLVRIASQKSQIWIFFTYL